MECRCAEDSYASGRVKQCTWQLHGFGKGRQTSIVAVGNCIGRAAGRKESLLKFQQTRKNLSFLTSRIAIFIAAIFYVSLIGLCCATSDSTLRDATIAKAANVENDKITMTVDLRTRISAITVEFRIKNVDLATPVSQILITPINFYHLNNGQQTSHDNSTKQENNSVHQRSAFEGMSLLSVTQNFTKVQLDVACVPALASCIVYLTTPIKPQDYTTIFVKYFTGHSIKPLPQKIRLHGETQKVVFRSTSLLRSPYPIKEQKSIYLLGDRIERFEPPEGEKNHNSVMFGPYFNTKQNEIGKPVFLHFDKKQNLGHFTNVVRTVKLSHYGHVFVHEEYFYKNEGAALDGEYNRQTISVNLGQIFGSLRQPGFVRTPSHIAYSLDGILPKEAFGIEYYDKIGNVTRSFARRDKSHVSLTIEPRFPVLGQWEADWQIEYNLPLHSVLSLIKGKHTHVLSLPLYLPFRNIFTDKLTIRVIVPSGSSDFKLYTPYKINTQHVGTFWSWLDVFMPSNIITITLNNVYAPSEFRRNMQVLYNSSDKILNLQKPLTCCFLAFIPFVIYLLVKHSSIRIETEDEKKLRQTRVMNASVATELWVLMSDVVETNWRIVDSIESIIKHYISGKGPQSASAINELLQMEKEKLDEANNKFWIGEVCGRSPITFAAVLSKFESLRAAVENCLNYFSTCVVSSEKTAKSRTPLSEANAYKRKIDEAEMSLINAIKLCEKTI